LVLRRLIKVMADTEDYEEGGAAGLHHTTHENGGSDEVTVEGLSGTLADPQTPAAHKTSHQDGGADEISVTGLSGVLADDQHVIDAEVQAIKLDDFTAPDDNTDLNVSTSKHGLAPKGTAGTTQFWRQDWTLATPAGGAKPVRRIIFPAACFEIRIAAGWAAFVQTQGTNFDYGELDFDKDTDEKANAPPFTFKNYDGGNIIITIAWKANATSGNVAWVASFAGIGAGEPFDAATTDHAFVAQTISDVAEDINIATLTVDPAELEADDTVLMKIYRDVSEDTLAVDAKLLYAQIEYTEA
jgi:hypothetical protein